MIIPPGSYWWVYLPYWQVALLGVGIAWILWVLASLVAFSIVRSGGLIWTLVFILGGSVLTLIARWFYLYLPWTNWALFGILLSLVLPPRNLEAMLTIVD